MDIKLEEEENIDLLNKLISAAEKGLLELVLEKCNDIEFVFYYKGFRGRVTENGIFRLCKIQDELTLYKHSSSQMVSALIDRLWIKILLTYNTTSKDRKSKFREAIKDF